MRVLHFAPVKGLKDFLKNSPYVSTYIDADLNPNVATYQADMTRMPYEDNSFDLLICSHIILYPRRQKGYAGNTSGTASGWKGLDRGYY